MRNTFRILAFVACAPIIAAAVSGCADIEAAQTQQRVAANVFEASRQIDLGHEATARMWLDRAIALAPNDVGTYLGFDGDGTGGVVWCLDQHNDWPDMVSYMSRAVANPKLAGQSQLWSALASAQDSLGQSAAARVSYARELAALGGATVAKGSELSPVDPEALVLDRANAEWGTGDRTRARADFQQFIMRFPQDAWEGQNALAYSEAVADVNLPEADAMAEAAVKAVRAAGASDQIVGEVVDTRAWVEYRMGQFGEAARDEDEAVCEIPREPVLHYHLAMIYQALKDNPDARIEIERAAALGPSDADTREAMRVIEPNTPAPTAPTPART